MSSRKTKGLVAGAAVFAVAAASATVGVVAANADSTTPPDGGYQYVAVGSDTLQGLYNSFANGNDALGTDAIAPIDTFDNLDSDGVAGGPITPQNKLVPSGASTITRPNGSGEGRAALAAAWGADNTDQKNAAHPFVVTPHSIDIARSSLLATKAQGVTSPVAGHSNLEFVPTAREAISIAQNGVVDADGAPWTWTTSELAAVYGGKDSGTTTQPGLSQAAIGLYIQSNDTADALTWANTTWTLTPGTAIDGAPIFTVDVPTVTAGNATATLLEGDSVLSTGDVVRENTSSAEQPYLVVDVEGGTASLEPIKAILPNPGSSGTAQFFHTAIGYDYTSSGTDDSKFVAPWLADAAANVAIPGGGSQNQNAAPYIPENNLEYVESNGVGTVEPFSIANWVAQYNGVLPSTRIGAASFKDTSVVLSDLTSATGTAVVPIIAADGGKIAPNPAFYGSTASAPVYGFGNFYRDVYSVVAVDEVSLDSDLLDLVQHTLPEDTAVITGLGFETIPYAATTNYYEDIANEASFIGYSGFTNGGTGTQAWVTDSTVKTPALTYSYDASTNGLTLTATVTVDQTTINADTPSKSGFVGGPHAVFAGDVQLYDNGAAVGEPTPIGLDGTVTFSTSVSNVSHSYTVKYVAGQLDASRFEPNTTASAAVVVKGTTTSAVTNTVAPTLSSTAKTGTAIKVASNGTWTDGTSSTGIHYAYAWYRSDSSTKVIGSASSYTPTPSDAGYTVSAKVTGFEDGAITSTVQTAPSAVIALAAGKGSISGTVSRGHKLTFKKTSSTWPTGSVTYHYQWYKVKGSKASKISGATKSTYTVSKSSSYKGDKIRVVVTATYNGVTSSSLTVTTSKKLK